MQRYLIKVIRHANFSKSLLNTNTDNEVMESTYGDLKVCRLIANLSVNHCGLQERTEEEKFLNLSSCSL